LNDEKVGFWQSFTPLYSFGDDPTETPETTTTEGQDVALGRRNRRTPSVTDQSESETPSRLTENHQQPIHDADGEDTDSERKNK
jgi:hypothetical protein